MEETEVDDEDEENHRLRRVKPHYGSGEGSAGRRRGDEDDDEETALAAWQSEVGGRSRTVRSRAENGSVGGERQQKDPMKRKRMSSVSVKFSEAAGAIVDIGKGLKKRADSVWRKDSGVEMQEPLQQVSGKCESKCDGNDADRLTGSAQRSSDEIRNTSADATPFSAQLMQGSGQFDASTPPRLSESAIAPFEASVVEQLERVQQIWQQRNPEALNQLSETPEHAPACTRHVTFQQFHDSKERERMAMMERQLRIAEREGAFDDAKRKKMFKETYSHRCNQRQQVQASDKLKANVAKEQRKTEEKFWRSQRDSSQADWNRFRLWSAARARMAGESGGRSALESGYASDDESSSRDRERRDAQRRRDARRMEEAEMATRYAGTALRSAPFIFKTRGCLVRWICLS